MLTPLPTRGLGRVGKPGSPKVWVRGPNAFSCARGGPPPGEPRRLFRLMELLFLTLSLCWPLKVLNVRPFGARALGPPGAHLLWPPPAEGLG
eukprot:2774963-Pyramimonas_sp.AAC.1